MRLFIYFGLLPLWLVMFSSCNSEDKKKESPVPANAPVP